MELFRVYNNSIWPAQIIAYILGTACLVAIAREKPWAKAFALATTGFLWLWNGIAYHYLFFSRINKAAPVFAALFVIQGLALIFTATRTINKADPLPPSKAVGWALIAYAMLLYPLLGLAFGHSYP